MTPRRGLVDVRPLPFERVRVRDDQRALTVFYWGGLEACYGLDRVDVRFARRTVTVTVYEGRVPTADVCAEVLQHKATKVRLEERVAGRRIVDGARTK